MAIASLPPFAYIGSFQGGLHIRSGDPLDTVWRHIERMGTVDNLARVATKRDVPTSNAKTASLRIRQAVELRRAAQGATILTKPLLLYYSSLNLIRGVMLAYFGDIGGTSHGLSFKPGQSLLTCWAEVKSGGTFRKFSDSLGRLDQYLQGNTFSLRDALASVPELKDDFRLLRSGPSSIANVRVKACRGDMKLTFHMDEVSKDEFREKWVEMLPWFENKCETTNDDFTLRVSESPDNADAVSEFCRTNLLHDLMMREDAWWFDHVIRQGIPLLHRIPAYLGGLFILSNISRYEPEYLNEVTKEATDVGYVITTFLECAERFLPQLMLERLNGQPVFFT